MSKVKTNAIAAGEPLAATPSDAPAGAAPSPVAPEVKSAAMGVLAAGAMPAATNPPAEAPAPEPNRPGLETPVAQTVPELPPNPFTELDRWKNGSTIGNLRAMEVAGGCLVKSSFAMPGFMGESICFVPQVRIEGGKLVGDGHP